MSEIAIRVEGLGKQYRIGKTQRHETLRDQIQHGITAPFRKMGALWRGEAGGANAKSELFWALKDVSFEVPRGSVLGVIGRNGAGKSTLLKILSRITEPTEGRAEIHGRVGSLLEVGTGFSGELSGRDNIFLNGAILGMKRAEIVRKFDEIVAFAEVEKFIDTAVKYYSSGMYMRLAFAVAAHLEPEILIVDEVLSVGDAAFQRKCIGKMGDVARDGRTILFVSHNLLALQKLCTQGLVLDAGVVQFQGAAWASLEWYRSHLTPSDNSGSVELSRIQSEDGGFRFLAICLLSPEERPIDRVHIGEDFLVRIRLQTKARFDGLVVGAAVHTIDETPLFASHWNDLSGAIALESGTWETTLRLSPNYLRQGSYVISLGALCREGFLARVPVACRFEVTPFHEAHSAKHIDERIGPLWFPMQWTEPVAVNPSIAHEVAM